MRIYLDACCLSRPFDDQTQTRIRAEADAVRAVMDSFENGAHEWIVSDVLEDELFRDPDEHRRRTILGWLAGARERVATDPPAILMARQWMAAGLRAMDALHAAVAEAARCDILLTTDDQFLRCWSRLDPLPAVRASNPARWIQESQA